MGATRQPGQRARRNGKQVRNLRSKLFEEYGALCWYCGDDTNENDLTIDHVYPLDKGGYDVYHNMVPACADCNVSKGNKTIVAWLFSGRAPDKLYEWINHCLHQTERTYGLYQKSHDWV